MPDGFQVLRLHALALTGEIVIEHAAVELAAQGREEFAVERLHRLLRLLGRQQLPQVFPVAAREVVGKLNDAAMAQIAGEEDAPQECMSHLRRQSLSATREGIAHGPQVGHEPCVHGSLRIKLRRARCAVMPAGEGSVEIHRPRRLRGQTDGFHDLMLDRRFIGGASGYRTGH